MVKYDRMDVYESMSFEWTPGREIRKTLRKNLGIENLRWFHKLGFALCFNYWDIGIVDFYSKMSSLEDEGFVTHRIVPKEIDNFL